MVVHTDERDWVNGNGREIGLKRVLVAFDFSDHSEQALKLGLVIAQEYQAELHLLHVLPPFTLNEPEISWYPLGSEGVYHKAARKLQKAVPAEVKERRNQELLRMRRVGPKSGGRVMSALKNLCALAAAVVMSAIASSGAVFAQTSGVGSDAITRVMWRGTDGTDLLQAFDINLHDIPAMQRIHGPYEGWAPVALTTCYGSNSSFLLWRTSDGRISLWRLNAQLDQADTKRERLQHVRLLRWRELDAVRNQPDSDHGSGRIRGPGGEQSQHGFFGHSDV